MVCLRRAGAHDPGPGRPRGVETRTIQGLSDDVQALTFNPDGTRLLSVDLSGNLRLWDFATGHEVAATTLTGLYVRKIRFSRDGKAPGCHGELHVHWRPATCGSWTPRPPARSGRSRVTPRVDDADFTPDGLRLATASLGPDGPTLGPRVRVRRILKWNEPARCVVDWGVWFPAAAA